MGTWLCMIVATGLILYGAYYASQVLGRRALEADARQRETMAAERKRKRLAQAAAGHGEPEDDDDSPVGRVDLTVPPDDLPAPFADPIAPPPQAEAAPPPPPSRKPRRESDDDGPIPLE